MKHSKKKREEEEVKSPQQFMCVEEEGKEKGKWKETRLSTAPLLKQRALCT